ncbi:MAG: DNA-formamidopyrimidine glycosylase, partial [Desulfovibrionaceae bacterium]|nr:DNA-formamidopyrimidine glycosylase [Desulfovibrionaceae bacterium]
ASLVFADLRRFGWCRAVSPNGFKDWDFFRSLGPKPLEIGPAEFADRFRGRRASIKALLLDQRVVAGVGNIYADEALFRAGIRPTARASDISPNRLRGLHAALSAVLGQAISENGSSIRDYVDSRGAAGAFQNSFRAYGRAGLACPRCGENMVRVRVAGRATTYCPGCQK